MRHARIFMPLIGIIAIIVGCVMWSRALTPLGEIAALLVVHIGAVALSAIEHAVSPRP